MTTELLIAGFGGQGVLFAGKCIAYKGLFEGRELSWLPSYGPEMRGGTANCSVVLSDDPVGSPIVNTPDVLIVMNLPSLDKYESAVVPGGKVFVDSTLIGRPVERADLTPFYVPATRLAQENGVPGLATMIMVGKVLKECDFTSFDGIEDAVRSVVSAKHPEMLDVNLKALRLGYDYQD